MGDLLLSVPLIQRLSESHAVHLCGRPGAAELLKTAGLVSGTSDAGGAFFLPLYAAGGDLPSPLTSFLRGFQRALVFSASQDLIVTERLRQVIPEVQRIVTIPQPGKGTHVSGFRWSQLFRDEPFPVPCLSCPEEHRELALELLSSRGWSPGRPLIVIHPGSGGRRKCWGLDRYEELMGMLRAEHDPFIIILNGPADEHLRDWTEGMGRRLKGVATVSGAGLMTVFGLLGLCDLYLGNDSGISHLAALSGCGVVSVFGPTDPVLWSPLGRRVRVIVPEAACAPCDRSYSCGDRICLSGTTAEMVLLQARALLNEKEEAGAANRLAPASSS